MEVKTIKLKQDEHTNIKHEFDKYDVIMLQGARGTGKSYPTADYVGEKLREDLKAKFVYMRNKKDELATFKGWCEDLKPKDLCGYDNYEFVRGKPVMGDITLKGFDDEGVLQYERVIGKCVSLETSSLYKSGHYDEFIAMVWEEYSTLKMNPENERTYVFNFLENVESFFRKRPKKIFLICNRLKNIPLLDRTIDKLTPKMFENPVKYKIFKIDDENSDDEFISYLNGEVYNDDNFIPKSDEFFTIYTNKNWIIKQHKIYSDKVFILRNNQKLKINYREFEFLNLKRFCQRSSNIDFYYKTKNLEKSFYEDYPALIREIQSFVSDAGFRFIMRT